MKNRVGRVTVNTRIFFFCLTILGIIVFIDNIHTLSANIKFICTSFRNRKKTGPFGELFWLYSQQLNLIINDINVHVGIYCLSCNVKKSKTTVKIV